jgi:hypothetical protein
LVFSLFLFASLLFFSLSSLLLLFGGLVRAVVTAVVTAYLFPLVGFLFRGISWVEDGFVIARDFVVRCDRFGVWVRGEWRGGTSWGGDTEIDGGGRAGGDGGGSG